jgi:hypothetical protein
MLRPAELLALLRLGLLLSSFRLLSHLREGVEYDYTGIQSIPVTGLSPARHTALWAATGRAGKVFTAERAESAEKTFRQRRPADKSPRSR